MNFLKVIQHGYQLLITLMFRIPGRLPLQHSYQIERRRIEPQSHYTHNFKTIDYRYILESERDQQSRQ